MTSPTPGKASSKFMAESTEQRNWAELLPDALGCIFRKLSLKERLCVVPLVCKSWKHVVYGPYCWKAIDLGEWSECCDTGLTDRMVRMLVHRSDHSFEQLSVAGLSEESFVFIAECAGSLKSLELPWSDISDSIVEQFAPKLANITFLDVSYCKRIGAPALEAVGKHCKSLKKLRRTMHPLKVTSISQDDEAHAIACTMPKLCHLDMAYMHLSTSSILEILSRCSQLNYLDIRGCWDVEIDGKYFQEKHPNLKVLGPDVDCYEKAIWDECSDMSDSSYAWEEMHDVDEAFERYWFDSSVLDALGIRPYDYEAEELYADRFFDGPSSP